MAVLMERKGVNDAHKFKRKKRGTRESGEKEREERRETERERERDSLVEIHRASIPSDTCEY